MSKFWRTQEFQALNKQWQDKLAKNGFEDIEEAQDRKALKQWHSRYFFIHYGRRIWRAADIEAYFYAARMFANDHSWPCIYDKVVWQFHAEGWSSREMAADIGKPANRWSIDEIVKKYRKIMLEQRSNSANAGF